MRAPTLAAVRFGQPRRWQNARPGWSVHLRAPGANACEYFTCVLEAANDESLGAVSSYARVLLMHRVGSSSYSQAIAYRHQLQPAEHCIHNTACTSINSEQSNGVRHRAQAGEWERMRTVVEARSPLLQAGARLLRDLLAHWLRRPGVAQTCPGAPALAAGRRECDDGQKD